MAFTWFPFPPYPPTLGLSSSWHDLALACEIYAVWQQTKYSQHTHTHTRTLRATHNILLFPTFSGANTLHLISSASAGREGNELCRRANSCASTNPGNYSRLRCGALQKFMAIDICKLAQTGYPIPEALSLLLRLVNVLRQCALESGC